MTLHTRILAVVVTILTLALTACGGGEAGVEGGGLPTSPVITVANAAQLQETAVMAEQLGWVNGVALSPDQRLLVISNESGRVYLWDWEKGELAQSLNFGNMGSIAFGSDGKTLLLLSWRHILIWNTATAEQREIELTERSYARFTSLALSPDGSTIATGQQSRDVGDDRGNSTLLWDVGSGERLRSIDETSPARSVAFSLDGRLIATGLQEGSIRIRETASGATVTTLVGHSDAITELAFSPAGDLLASASMDGSVRLWDLASWAERLVLVGHTDRVEGIAFTPDASVLASVGRDRTLRLWDVASGVELVTLFPSVTGTGISSSITAVDCSADGSALITGTGEGRIHVWRVPN